MILYYWKLGYWGTRCENSPIKDLLDARMAPLEGDRRLGKDCSTVAH